MKRIPIPIFLFCILLLSGCATADLFPKDLEVTPDAAEQGKMLLLQSMQKRDPQDHWSQLTFMKVVARDNWESQTARLFTLIPQASQQVQFAFNLTNDDAYMKFLEGDQNGNAIGIEDGVTYFVTRGKREEKTSKRVDSYLPPVKNYFLWPQTIHNLKNIVYLGEEDLGLRRYYKIFASNGDDFTGGAEDQYIIWVNRQTLHIEYIEFDLKELVKAYHGVVQYREYRDVDGVLLPHEITLLDGLETLSFSHKFYVQIQTLQ